jgi:hypothetical protein
MFGEGSEKFDSLGSGDVCELGIHVTEGGDEFCPMLPIALPFFVIRRHDASVNVFPLSSEKTSEVILELRRKLRQEVSCKGKVELNKCKKLSSERVNVS